MSSMSAALALSAVCLSAQALAAPLVSNGTTGGATEANATCFLYQFRSFTPEQAARQGISFAHNEFVNGVGTTVFSLVILGVSLLLLLAGERLFKPTLFLSGFGLASVFSFFGLNAAFNAAHWSNCALMGVLPVVVGIIAGTFALWLLNTAFFLVGGCFGTVAGFYVYTLLHVVFKLSVDGAHTFAHHDVLFWICLLAGCLLGGLLALKLERGILVLATAVVGGMGTAVASAYLVLVRLDPTLTPQHLSSGHAPLGFAIGWLAGALLVTVFGMWVQYRCFLRSPKHAGANSYSGDIQYHQIPYQ